MAVVKSGTPFLIFKYSVIGIAFFTILAWILALGGLSALEEKCHGIQRDGTYCDSRVQYGLPWFVIWFQFVLIFPIFFIEFFDRGSWRPTLMLLLAINTVLTILQCERFLDEKKLLGKSSRYNATIAGFIILSIFNLLLIILSGSRNALEHRYGEDRNLGVATYAKKPTTASQSPNNSTSQVTTPPPQSTYGATGTAPAPV